MFPTKYPHPANFTFADVYQEANRTLGVSGATRKIKVDAFVGDVYRITVGGGSPNKCLTELTPPVRGKGRATLSPNAGITFADKSGTPYLQGLDGLTFGFSGGQWLLRFHVDEDTRYYGLGEKSMGRAEYAGVRTKFYNLDVWSDFAATQWNDQPLDPPYLSIPYVILRRGSRYVGILLHCAYPSFMDLQAEEKDTLVLGAEGGQPDVWVIHGPSLKELTRKLQKLVGVTPTPPLWSLGYHQCRWGYAGEKDLLHLDAEFAKHEIPCDGLWLDIDYMRGYRVFTVSDEHFPKGVAHTIAKLAANGRKVVPILDPGVKLDPEFDVYQDGKRHNVFCKNVTGAEFVGIVWPGKTVFPDFTLPKARDWWSGYCEKFIQSGFSAAWVDMNDPSTGSVDPEGMLFNEGKELHVQHRNQYALGMQKATHAGFLRAKPNERPFILTRSGFIGTSKYAAAWTGDNVSNYFYLRHSIATTLNLALSGLCFNGPDMGGFGKDTTDGLMADWVKAGFLFPFCRNHNAFGQRDQEPWTLAPETTAEMRRYIRLRYKFLPYLYNLFIDQEELGDPPMRPLAYEHPEALFEDTAFQFLVGPYILQAPVLDPKKRTVSAVLPGRTPWLDARTGDWRRRKTRQTPGPSETPLFFKQGSIIPMLKGVSTDIQKDLSNIDVLVAVQPGTRGRSSTVYRADDGLTFDYRSGKRSALEISVAWSGDSLRIDTKSISEGFGPIVPEFLVPMGFGEVLVNGKNVAHCVDTLELTGRPLQWLRLAHQ